MRFILMSCGRTFFAPRSPSVWPAVADAGGACFSRPICCSLRSRLRLSLPAVRIALRRGLRIPRCRFVRARRRWRLNGSRGRRRLGSAGCGFLFRISRARFRLRIASVHSLAGDRMFQVLAASLDRVWVPAAPWVETGFFPTDWPASPQSGIWEVALWPVQLPRPVFGPSGSTALASSVRR